MRIMIDGKQVATIEESELFGTESFFGVSGADYELEAGRWQSNSKLPKAKSDPFRKIKKKVVGSASDEVEDDEEEYFGTAQERGKTLPYSV